jgi:DNA-directed RNA polymerase subunit RPC12/RpoP
VKGGAIMAKMVPLTCIKCGGNLEIEQGRETYYCPYCGTKLLLDDPSTVTVNKNIRIENVSIDQTEVEKMRIQKEMWDNRESLGSTLLKLFLFEVGCLLLIALCCLLMYL